MSYEFLAQYAYVVLFVLTGALLVGVMLGAARLLREDHPGGEKAFSYECGNLPVGGPWIQLHIRYYAIALIFIVFDVETAFLLPWAVVFRRMGFQGLWAMMAFVGVLLLGLLYAWRKGDLDWV